MGQFWAHRHQSLFEKQRVWSLIFKLMFWKLCFIVASGISFWTKMYAWTKRCCPTEQNVNRCQVQLIWHNFPYFIFSVLGKDYKIVDLAVLLLFFHIIICSNRCKNIWICLFMHPAPPPNYSNMLAKYELRI